MSGNCVWHVPQTITSACVLVCTVAVTSSLLLSLGDAAASSRHPPSFISTSTSADDSTPLSEEAIGVPTSKHSHQRTIEMSQYFRFPLRFRSNHVLFPFIPSSQKYEPALQFIFLFSPMFLFNAYFTSITVLIQHLSSMVTLKTYDYIKRQNKPIEEKN